MTWPTVIAEVLIALLRDHPDVLVLTLLGIGGYYELHHGRIASMAENQYVLGTAVYSLLKESDAHDAEAFRKDLWEKEEEKAYPGDWDATEPPGDD